MSGSEVSDSGSPLPWQRGLILGIAVLAIIHTVLIALWLSPPSPIRNAVGAQSLARYVDPYFQQSWQSLDPNLQKIDETLSIRARVLDPDGTESITPWFDITAKENTALRHSLQPARVRAITHRLGTNLNATMLGFTETERKLVATNYRQTPMRELAVKLLEAGASPNSVANYIAYDRMATQFASLYATAKWDKTVMEIQYRVGRRAVPRFKDRNNISLAATNFTYFSFGWRVAYGGQMEAQSAFNTYVKK